MINYKDVDVSGIKQCLGKLQHHKYLMKIGFVAELIDNPDLRQKLMKIGFLAELSDKLDLREILMKIGFVDELIDESEFDTKI